MNKKSIVIKQFYSKSKNNDDLNIGCANWRKVLSNFHVLEKPLVFEGAEFTTCEHAFHAAKGLAFMQNFNANIAVMYIYV